MLLMKTWNVLFRTKNHDHFVVKIEIYNNGHKQRCIYLLLDRKQNGKY
jgi:hypothetical protein